MLVDEFTQNLCDDYLDDEDLSRTVYEMLCSIADAFEYKDYDEQRDLIKKIDLAEARAIISKKGKEPHPDFRFNHSRIWGALKNLFVACKAPGGQC
jgi:hypothetical protein